MKEILKRAKALVETTKVLMQALKSQADKDDPDSRKRLLNAVRELATATSKMAQLAKGVATSRDKAALGKVVKSRSWQETFFIFYAFYPQENSTKKRNTL